MPEAEVPGVPQGAVGVTSVMDVWSVSGKQWSLGKSLPLVFPQRSAKQSYAVMPKVISMDHLTKQVALTCSIIFSHGPLFFFGASGNLNYI